jgi:uncharacterized protein YdaU (DUF1376 family)
MSENGRFPWFRLFSKNFVADTLGLRPEEIGTYTVLVCKAWDLDGTLPVSPKELSLLTGVRCSLIRATLKSLSSRGLIHVAESGFRLRIIDHELDRAERRSRHGRMAAACRWAVIKGGRDE